MMLPNCSWCSNLEAKFFMEQILGDYLNKHWFISLDFTNRPLVSCGGLWRI